MKKMSYTAPELKVHGSIAELTHMPTKVAGDSDGISLIIPGLPNVTGGSGSTCAC